MLVYLYSTIKMIHGPINVKNHLTFNTVPLMAVLNDKDVYQC